MNVLDKIYYYFHDAVDMHLDGFYQFEQKKKLYEIKWLVDHLLSRCPTFIGEEEFVNKNRSRYESTKG